MSYRRSDIKYRRNEAFVDVIENVNHLMSATGQRSPAYPHPCSLYRPNSRSRSRSLLPFHYLFISLFLYQYNINSQEPPFEQMSPAKS